MTHRCTVQPRGKAAAMAAQVAASIPTLRTERLSLRAPHLGDLPLWTKLYRGDWAAGGPEGPERAWETFSYYAAGWLLHGHGLWCIERAADGLPIGFVLVGLEWEDAAPELGYIVAPEHRGQGYALEASQAARDFALELLGRGGLVSYVTPENAASNVLASRLGGRRDRAAEANTPDDIHIWRYGVS